MFAGDFSDEMLRPRPSSGVFSHCLKAQVAMHCKFQTGHGVSEFERCGQHSCRRKKAPWFLSRARVALLLLAGIAASSTGCPTAMCGQDAPQFQALQARFTSDVQPILQEFCLGCHSAVKREGEFDLERFATFSDVRGDVKAWQKMAEMLENGEMPPDDSPQPDSATRRTLQSWIDSYLDAEALSRAGDPGPVILRRLSNAEYNYTVSDLTGVSTLNPTREFPVDGAAGEGFTNTGSAQAMSPALVQKYLDAAKEVAAHAVLHPDGIEFSEFTTQRDQTDERVARIQAFYRQFTADGGGQTVNLQGNLIDTNQGGLLPVERYLAATLQEREGLLSGRRSLAEVAADRSLHEKYLSRIWRALSEARPADPPGPSGFLLERLRRAWTAAGPDDAPKLAASIAEAQAVLWKYHPVGHIGRDGRPVDWMEPVSPVVDRREFSLTLPAASTGEISVILIASDADDGHEQDFVVWENPRLTGGGGPDIPLCYVAGIQQRIAELQRTALARTPVYLQAVSEFDGESDPAEQRLHALAERHRLETDLLRAWINYLDIGRPEPVVVAGHPAEKLTASGHDFVRGWGSAETPSILGNSSAREVRIPGMIRPHSIVAHPSPALYIAAGWQSPISGMVRIQARMADAHPECGNGQEWHVQHRTGRRVTSLGQGSFETGGSAEMPAATIAVRAGELVSLMVGPREGNHSCDLTEISLVVSELDGAGRTWDLAGDCSSDLQSANPHADSYGHPGVWHFYQGPVSALVLESGAPVSVPRGSLLWRWQQESDPATRLAIARQISDLVTSEPPADAASPDAVLTGHLRNLVQSAYSMGTVLTGAEADPRFGQRPPDLNAQPTDLIVQAPSAMEFRIPASLAAGRTFVATGRCGRPAAKPDAAPNLPDGSAGIPDFDGTVQLDVRSAEQLGLPDDSDERSRMVRNLPGQLAISSPIVVNTGGTAHARTEAGFAEFRQLFPPNLCYARIVPVDEVVTLTLFYRNDEHLQRLMLNDEQTAQLNRLWDELLFVAQEPLKYQVAFEQIREFATQDRPDLVAVWTPLVQLVEDRAAAFRQRLSDTEPAHLAALMRFAATAWRRSLTEDERVSLQSLYQSLRLTEMPHDESIRLGLARILTSPAFLYRHETVLDAAEPHPVNDLELANRLSYFLWSSMPDAQLRAVAEAGQLTGTLPGHAPNTDPVSGTGRDSGAVAQPDDEVVRQARRMLKDARIRRLAVQFACQWLQVRDFDQNSDKNERLFPEFAELKDDMYEETVRFFEDMFRSDGSILSILDADHAFLSEPLARHYGIEWSQVEPGSSAAWRRVDGLQGLGRGGVLGMATFLASQSGASRTSPILRGNWVYETLLGERLPRPPAGVPTLPEEAPAGLTDRQLIEQHSSSAACAKCHIRIDPYGFALEKYDPVGRLRPATVDTKATLADGTSIDGMEGLRRHLLNERRDDIVRHFCRKLLGYSLGREVQLSDRPLLDQMLRDLSQNGYRVGMAVDTIVQSSQFRRVRGDHVSAEQQ